MFLLAFATMVFAGCSSTQSVGHMQGHGSTQIYNAGFDRVWNAAVAAAQQGHLEIVTVDKENGFISTKRGLEPDSFGENVGIWVHKSNSRETWVEVVSRLEGPPVFGMHNWEHRILNSISANLTTATAGL